MAVGELHHVRTHQLLQLGPDVRMAESEIKGFVGVLHFNVGDFVLARENWVIPGGEALGTFHACGGEF